MIRLRLFFSSYHPIVFSLIFGTVLARIATSMSMPFLAIYLASHTTMTPLYIGIVIGMGSLAGAFGGFLGGSLSDRFGRRVIMFIALFAWSAVFFGFSVAAAPVAFMLLNMLNGLCRSFFEPVSQALMADLTEPSKRLEVFSMRYMAANVGVAVGPLIGAYMGMNSGASPFMITAIIYLIYAMLLYALLQFFGIKQTENESEHKERITLAAAWRVVRSDRTLRLFLAGGIIIATGYSQMTVTLSQYSSNHFANGVKLFAVLMSVNAITVICLQMPLVAWVRSRTPIFGVHMGNVMFAAGFIGFALSGSWLTMVISMIIFTIGEILNYPSGNMLMDRLAPEGMRGTYFGAQSFSSLGHFIGPWAGGMLLSAYGGPWLFTIMAAVTCFGSVFYWAGQRNFDRITQDRIPPSSKGLES
jgi:MFS family permease